MLKGLITSLLVSMGVVSPTTNTPSFNMSQQKENKSIRLNAENEHDYSLDINTNQLTNRSQTTVPTGSYAPMSGYDIKTQYRTSTHAEKTAYNSFVNVIMKENTQQYYIDLENSNIVEDPVTNYLMHPLIGNSQPNMTKYGLTNMTTLQIQPYLYNDQTVLNFNYYSRVNIYNTQNRYSIKTFILTSIENLYSYTTVSYTEQYRNENIWSELTGTNSTYQYTLQEFDNTIDQTSREFEIQTQIPLVGDHTNYIFIYSYVYDKINQTNSQGFFTANLPPTNTWLYSTYTNLSGTYVPNVQGYEVIDIPGLMWQVLTMPFTFISIAFNFTLFPGTPYQLDLSQIFLMILGLLIMIFLIKKLIQAKTGL